ncbi:hypothetical protein H8R18_08615 [Nanchangia anserum]|nr:hypothetical protein [Nanchangia anserum]QOX81759.1 hypothetical protein H8R18_08615 [Nanchangia anserum]
MSASLSPGLAGERPRELSAGEGGSGTVLMVGLLAVAVAYPSPLAHSPG